MKKILLALLIAPCSLWAQNVGVGTSAPNKFAILDVEVPSATNPQGLLLPRLKNADRLTLGGSLGATENGLTVFDIDDAMTYVWDGTAWTALGAGASDTDWTEDVNYIYNTSGKKVGIGTNAPTSDFEVNLAASNGGINIRSASAFNSYLRFWEATSVRGYIMMNGNTHDVTLAGLAGNVYIDAGTGTSPGIVVSDGQVGIGIASPTTGTDLHVHDPYNNSSAIRLTNTVSGTSGTDGLQIELNGSGASILNREASPMYLGTSGANVVTITTDGNVAVGATGATDKLDVNGSAQADSFKFSSPFTHYVHYGPADFTPSFNDPNNMYILEGTGALGRFVNGSTAGKLFAEANLHIPHNAKILEVVVYMHDDNAMNDVEVELLETDHTGGDTPLGAVNTTNAPGVVKTAFGVGHQVDLVNKYYKLRFNSVEDDGGAILGLYGVIVMYSTEFAE